MHIDRLESRRLLSVSLSNGTLSIVGTSGDNKIVVSQGLKIYVVLDSSITSYVLNQVSKVTISAGAGRDNITLDKTLLLPASIYGGLGNDTIVPDSPAADYISGGADVDYIDYSNRTSALNLSNDGTANDGVTGEKDNLAVDVETITGGSGNDTIDLRYNTVGTGHGAKGNDTIYGSAFGDLDGGPGNDQLFGQLGSNAYYGGDGFDWAFYNEASHTGKNLHITLDDVSNDGASGENDNVHSDIEAVAGNTGDDYIESNINKPLHVESLLGNDTIITHYGNDSVYGGGGNDSIDAGLGADTIGGGDGYDTVTYASRTIPLLIAMDSLANDGEVSHTVNGQQLPAENDNINNDVEKVIGGSAGDNFIGNSLANYFVGNGGNDYFNDAGGNDTCDGGDGSDSFNWAAGSDVYFGGAAVDGITYATASSAVNVTLDGLKNDGTAGEKDNVGADIEQVKGSFFNDTLIGNGKANYLDGVDGNDTLDGTGGDDTLIGGADDDSLIGGSGNDTVEYNDHAFNLNLSIDGIANDGASGEKDNITGSIENINGGMGNDKIVGNSSANNLRGFGGNDTIDGGLGADSVDGQSGNDIVDYSTRSVAVKVEFGVGGNGQAGENDVFTNCEGAIGGSGNDTLSAGAATLTVNFDGGDGNDSITSYDGDDTIHGGNGDDIINAGKGKNTVYGDAGKDSISAGSGDDFLSGGDDNDFISAGDGADSINGDAGDDNLQGGAGNDTIHGGDGKDSLQGDAGADKLYGDAGNDKFFAQDNTKDTLNGGAGVDIIGSKDGIDSLTSVP